MRYEHTDAEKESTPAPGGRANTMAGICDWLGVSTSGNYEWHSRPISATAQRRDPLKLFSNKEFDESDKTYGHRRVHAQLLRWGETCAPELVRALIRERGLEPCRPRPRPWRHSLTDADPAAGPIPDWTPTTFVDTGSSSSQCQVGSARWFQSGRSTLRNTRQRP